MPTLLDLLAIFDTIDICIFFLMLSFSGLHATTFSWSSFSLSYPSVSSVGISSSAQILNNISGVFPSFVFFSLYTYLKWSDSFLLLMPHKSIIPSSGSILRHTLIYPTAFLISFLGYPSGTSSIVYSKWTNHFSPNEWVELILQYPQLSEWHHHTLIFKPTT